MTKIFIRTQGCSHNYADSEHMAGLLTQAGHELTQQEAEADLILFNTCTVKTPSENSFLRELESTRDKKIIIGGCIPQSDPARFKDFSLIGTRQLDHIVEVVEKTVSGQTVQLLQRNEHPSLLVDKLRRNPLIETIPISLGCMSACSFCKTKFARGNLSSYPKEEIIDKVRKVTSEGIKELWLTSQDTGCYGFDINTNLADLLEDVCRIEKDFMIRVGMANPQHILKIKDSLIKAYKNQRVFKFLHIPLQSGNNDILKAMKRDYSIEQFKQAVSAFRQEIPDITISTDIICGFPGETKEQFNDTMNVIKEIKPDFCNISRFWLRPGTGAARMKGQLSGGETKRRSTMLTNEFRKISLEKNKQWCGWEGDVVITEMGKENEWLGRNNAYKLVAMRGSAHVGDKQRVKITGATTFHLNGQII